MNYIRFKEIFLGLMVLAIILISGCIEEKKENNEDETNGEIIDQDYENIILGTWVKNQTLNNFTFIIEYKFFSNQSFFSGIKHENFETYNDSIWGMYSIDSEEIQFIVEGDNPSNSTLKYLISQEEDLLLIYYEDEINYDVFRKVT